MLDSSISEKLLNHLTNFFLLHNIDFDSEDNVFSDMNPFLKTNIGLKKTTMNNTAHFNKILNNSLHF